MAPRKKSVTEYLESRIQFYRYCAVALLVLGLLAGASVLCEKCALFSVGWFGRYQVLVKCTLCFAVSLSGIAAASHPRHRALLHLIAVTKR